MDLGENITIMIMHMMKLFELIDLHPTSTILELENRSIIKLKGVLDNVTVSLNSWEYIMSFMVLQTIKKLEGI